MKRTIILLSSALVLAACADKIDKNVEWPQWASRPIIEELSVTSPDGQGIVTAGSTVNFSATLSDEFNPLAEATLSVKFNDSEVISKSFQLSGNSTKLECALDYPYSAYLPKEEFYPEILLRVVNSEGGFAETRVPGDKNVKVVRPAAPEKLYIIDNAGHNFTITPVSGGSLSYEVAPGTDISALGESIYVASALKGGAPDFSKPVWGMKDGEIAVVGEGGDRIPIPSSEGYGFKNIGFDTYAFKLLKMVNLTITIDRSQMEEVSQGSITYLGKKDVKLVRDCEIEFLGFGELKAMLQPDRFEITGETTAKFTGHSQFWSFWYDPDDNWMILDYAWNNMPDQMWITGELACFPLGNDNTANEFKYLDGDGKVRFATLAAIRSSDTDYHCLIYFKDNFTIQLYSWMKWSTVISMTSATPELAKITGDKIYMRPGDKFTPGLYMLDIHITKAANNDGDGAEAEISLTPYTL